jgi:hypothetical protein
MGLLRRSFVTNRSAAGHGRLKGEPQEVRDFLGRRVHDPRNVAALLLRADGEQLRPVHGHRRAHDHRCGVWLERLANGLVGIESERHRVARVAEHARDQETGLAVGLRDDHRRIEPLHRLRIDFTEEAETPGEERIVVAAHLVEAARERLLEGEVDDVPDEADDRDAGEGEALAQLERGTRGTIRPHREPDRGRTPLVRVDPGERSRDRRLAEQFVSREARGAPHGRGLRLRHITDEQEGSPSRASRSSRLRGSTEVARSVLLVHRRQL